MEHSFNKVIDLLFLAKQEGVEVVFNDERLQLKVGENEDINEMIIEIEVVQCNKDFRQALTNNQK